jgi:F-type H+-transporting ATPase subunit b
MELITPGVGLVFWTTLVFLLVLGFLSKFAWKPIMTALEEREKSIETALSEAENARNEMKKLQASNEALLQEARVERDAILKEARSAANVMIEEAKERGNKEFNALLDSARTEIKRERDAAMASLQAQVADLTITVAEKILRKQLDNSAASKELVNDYLKDLKLN